MPGRLHPPPVALWAFEDDGENQIIKGVTQGVGETSFEIDCRDMINPQMPTLEECATNDTYNCIFNIWDGTYNNSDDKLL